MDFIAAHENNVIKSLKKNVDEMIFEEKPGFYKIDNYACLNGTVKKIDMSNTKINTFGAGAFMNCLYLSNVIFPESLTTIENNAFCRTALKQISIPKNVKTMKNSTWTQREVIEAFIVDKENKYFSAEKGCLYNIDKTILYRATNNITSFLDIPNFKNIKVISGFALTYVPITSFIAEKSLMIVETYGFHVVNDLKILDLTYSQITELPQSFIIACPSLIILRCPLSLNSIKYAAIKSANVVEIIIHSHLENLEESALWFKRLL